MPDTIDGYRAAIDRLPTVVTAALRGTAKDTADRVAKRAAEILRSKTHGTGITAGNITVEEQADRKQFLVISIEPPEAGRWPNLPIALEYGTRFMTARAYMRPARDEASAGYVRDMERAAVDAVSNLLG